MNKHIQLALLGFALTAGPAAIAQEEGPAFSANFALTSDYRFRGISQSDTGVALQGGFDLDLGNGFYAGTWGSSVDFGYAGTSMEQDWYMGYSGSVSETVSFDVGYLYYDYPGSDVKEDYQELYGSISVADFSFGIAYSDDYFAETGKFTYYSLDYGTELAGVSLSAHVGYNSFDEVGFVQDEDSYLDYSVALSKEFNGVEVGLALVGTDVDDFGCYDTDWCEATGVLSFSKSL
ncbi:TorF family putative porin [Biformimicrobium ophioploci]|uniref:TorF family putative porin n=1 Tax=Biformimicrobium ophioploci TaxID=3036711 RepID=A0ABQ6LV49_9GAMM|nr:TorF family putative porin [Microbulbifer sp. NKW57]GMG85954.1 TorF family putative porin [Microbulbifer sp. NKW57]